MHFDFVGNGILAVLAGRTLAQRAHEAARQTQPGDSTARAAGSWALRG
jgi:hypothetical protein